jgi:hypothetical protein
MVQYDFYNVIAELSTIKSIAMYSQDKSLIKSARQDLYQLRWYIDHIINQSPKFDGEDNWLKDQEQIKVLNYLRK